MVSGLKCNNLVLVIRKIKWDTAILQTKYQTCPPVFRLKKNVCSVLFIIFPYCVCVLMVFFFFFLNKTSAPSGYKQNIAVKSCVFFFFFLIFLFKSSLWDFPQGLVVKTLSSNAGGVGSIPGSGAKIPHVSWPRKPRLRSNIVINSMK